MENSILFFEILDAHPNSNIRAVLTGHIHGFYSFKRNNIYFITVCSGARNFARIANPVGKYRNGIDGPITDSNKSFGLLYHLKSVWRINAYVNILLNDNIIYYKIIDIMTNKSVITFE